MRVKLKVLVNYQHKEGAKGMEIILPSVISGIFAVIVSLITNLSTNKKLINDFKSEVTKNQAVTDTKLEELTREVREHNNFARRMPVVENEIKHIEEEIHKYHK